MRTRAWSCTLGVAAAVACWPESARAYETEVDASVTAQYYSLSSPWGSPELRRRRYTQTLGLAVWNIQGVSDPRAPRLSFQTRMRLDADFGQSSAERVLGSASYIPGLQEAPLDLMYAYLEGQRYLDGYVSFKLGRQYVFDTLGFWSFDGGFVTLSAPANLVVEAYAGFEQRGGGIPYFGTRRFEAQGVYRGDRTGYDANYYPLFLDESRLAPAAGLALEASAFGVLHSRLSYRKVMNRDEVNVSPFVDLGNGQYFLRGTRTSSERLGYSLRASSKDLGTVNGSFVYDFYNQIFSQYGVDASALLTSRYTVGASFDSYTPTFDGDSIFNWFSHSPTTSALVRGEARFSRRFQASLQAGVRWFETEGNPSTYAVSPNAEEKHRLYDFTADASARYDLGDTKLGLRGGGETGERGHRFGADLTGQRRFTARYDGVCVLSLWDWSDGLRPERDATSFGYVLGAGVTPGPNFFARSRFGIELEHQMNRVVGQRFRALLTLDLTVLK
ncbi:MAG: hypothetical protein EOO73_33835 [Myxococcales bacterium]|nr:MAG: hypothetical protein EOO73_33835 [Myxococcales bacterium]